MSDLELPDHPIAKIKLIEYALNKHLGRCGMFFLNDAGLMLDMARKNDKRPAWIKIAVPDEMVVNMKGRPGLMDAYVFIKVPREVVDKFNSPIIDPKEA
jgi:hypothetical protein